MTFRVTVSNEVERKAARKILRGRGLPTSEVHRMSYAALTAALADCDANTWGMAMMHVAPSLKDVRPVETAPRESGPDDSGPDVVEDPSDAKEQAQAQAEADRQNGKGAGGKSGQPDALEARVRQIIAEWYATAESKPAVDPDEVRRIAEDVLKEQDRPVRLEIVRPDQTVIESDSTTHYMMADVLKALAARCHVWLPGPAGSGKSTLGRQCGVALGYSDPEPNEPFETAMRIHMTGAIETPFQLTGYRSPNGDPATLMTPFRKAWQYGGLFIFDDVDRSNPKALAAFNEALANGHCAFPDGVVKAHETFLCIATANTFGLGGGTDYVGAARLDKATLDRFVYFEVPYDVGQEKAIARSLDSERGPEWCAFVQSVRAACKSLGLKHLVTPRSTYKGLRLMAAGLDRDKVESATVYAGLDGETLARVKGAL